MTRIARQPDKKGARSTARDQAVFEKSSSGTNSAQNADKDNHAEDIPQRGPDQAQQQRLIQTRNKWIREEYKKVIEAYYTALNHPTTSITTAAYDIWRKNNPLSRPNMDANKLANTRRDIIKNKRLTDIELQAIKNNITNNQNETLRNSQSDRNDANEQDEVITADNPEDQPAEQEQIKDDEENIDEQDQEVEEMITNIMRKWEIVKETAIDERPELPKVNNYNKNTKAVIELANKALQKIKQDLGNNLTITEVNELCYASASSIIDSLGIKTRRKKAAKNKPTIPKWRKQIENDIRNIRSELSILCEISKNTDNVNEKKRKSIFKKHNIKNKDDIQIAIERLKQQLQAKSQRIRRLDKKRKFYHHNKLYKENTKKFYRDLGKKKIEVQTPPEKEDVEIFWSNIWERKKSHNENTEWIKQIEQANQLTPEQDWPEISLEETVTAIKQSSNWKTPGKDGIANFWLKHLTTLHKDLTNAYNDCIRNPDVCPKWLTSGTTFLLPKNEETANPKNYRPITCLPTMYKILTSILTSRTYTHFINNNLLPAEQKGCRKGSYGCKDQLLINKAIMEEVKAKKKNITTAWIDYKKAFDSVPHTWILKCLQMYHVSPTMISFITTNMTKWNTTLILNHVKGTITSRNININSGIFQGDSLSPLLFCIALAPLSYLLNESGYGYRTGNKVINHLFYMDDLKTYTKTNDEQTGLLTIVKGYSDDIGMEFGLDKCAKATFKKGKLTRAENIELDVTTTIQDLDQEETYKYLGVNEGNGIQHAMMKEKIRKEYYRRIRLVLKSELNATNKIDAINTLAVPVVTYSYNIINWKMEELKCLDRKTRKLLTMNKMHHPKADVDRLYLPRTTGGRGLIQIETSYKTTTIGLGTYLNDKEDHLLQIAKEHDKAKKLFSVHREAKKFRRELNLPAVEKTSANEPSTNYARRTKVKAKQQAQEQLKNNWEEKPLHGKYPRRLNDNDVDQAQTNKWLKTSGLKSETEGFIIAAQDQCIKTNYYRNKILKDGCNPMCRICSQHLETIDHVVSGCPELAKTEYIHRHNKAAMYIHWKLCKYYDIDVTERYYKHEPTTVTENDQVTILWDMPIQTDREITANRPDIVVKDKVNKTCLLIDMSVPTERNISIKTMEKLSKYKDLEIEIERMWGLKATTVPVIIGALGLIKKGLDNFINRIPGNIKVIELQKIVLLGTAHILRRTLSYK